MEVSEQLNFGHVERDPVAEVSHMDYEDMLRRIRNSALNDAIFSAQFYAVLKAKRHALSPEARQAISERVGY